jgi:hypothetical protein
VRRVSTLTDSLSTCEVGLLLAPATASRPAMSEYFIVIESGDVWQEQTLGTVKDIVLAYTRYAELR